MTNFNDVPASVQRSREIRKIAYQLRTPYTAIKEIKLILRPTGIEGIGRAPAGCQYACQDYINHHGGSIQRYGYHINGQWVENTDNPVRNKMLAALLWQARKIYRELNKD